VSVAGAERPPLRVPASLLQEACRLLLPGYSAARREPERLALLTRACLERSEPARLNGRSPAAVARRSGLFRPGSSTPEASCKRSHLELIQRSRRACPRARPPGRWPRSTRTRPSGAT